VVSGSSTQAAELLSVVPPELLSIILSQLSIPDLACLAATCRSLWCDATTPLPEMTTPGLAETELRRRANARGLDIGSAMPDQFLSWVPYLLQRDFHDALRREAPLAVGYAPHSIFVDRDGHLHLDCRREAIGAGEVGAPLLDHTWESAFAVYSAFVPFTPVPSMQDKRIMSVSTGDAHCLALSVEGEVYSWGATHGALGHAGGLVGFGPRMIETLARIESISAGMLTSAAVDDRGRLFTWGRASLGGRPTGLGYELEPQTMRWPTTPKKVDALSDDRVVGVALGAAFLPPSRTAWVRKPVYLCGRTSSLLFFMGRFMPSN